MRELLDRQLSLLLIQPTHLRVPAERSDLVAAIYQTGQVLKREELDDAIELSARLPAKLKATLSAYVLS